MEQRRDTALTVTAEEMAERYGTGIPAAEAGKTEKKAGEKKPRKPAEKKEKKNLPVDPEAAPVGKPIIGRSIADRPVEIKELNAESGLVVIQGEIFKLEQKELKGGEMVLVTFGVTDYTSSVLCKIFFRYRARGFARKDEEPAPITDEERKAVTDKVERIKKGMCVKLRGECLYDSYARELSISVRDLILFLGAAFFKAVLLLVSSLLSKY